MTGDQSSYLHLQPQLDIVYKGYVIVEYICDALQNVFLAAKAAQ